MEKAIMNKEMNDDMERVLLRAEGWVEEGFARLHACLLWCFDLVWGDGRREREGGQTSVTASLFARSHQMISREICNPLSITPLIVFLGTCAHHLQFIISPVRLHV